MSKAKYIEITIDDSQLLYLLNHNFFNSFVFRGQGDKKWPLETALRRLIETYHKVEIPKNAGITYEREMLKEFKWKYPVYQTNPNMIPQSEESIEWLSIMQHFGTKTRMLDFTDSLFVAIFMALDGANNCDSAVWALNKNIIRDTFKRTFEEDGRRINDEDADRVMYSKAQDWLNKDAQREEDYDYKRLYIVRPRLCNERISRQQGLFILPSTLSHPFESIVSEYCEMDNAMEMTFGEFGKFLSVLGSDKEVGLIKIIIPDSIRHKIVRDLQMMNISSETMYPGIVGLAQSINHIRTISYEYTEGSTPAIR